MLIHMQGTCSAVDSTMGVIVHVYLLWLVKLTLHAHITQVAPQDFESVSIEFHILALAWALRECHATCRCSCPLFVLISN